MVNLSISRECQVGRVRTEKDGPNAGRMWVTLDYMGGNHQVKVGQGVTIPAVGTSGLAEISLELVRAQVYDRDEMVYRPSECLGFRPLKVGIVEGKVGGGKA